MSLRTLRASPVHLADQPPLIKYLRRDTLLRLDRVRRALVGLKAMD